MKYVCRVIKKDRILQFIHEFLLKERVTKRQVLQLLGHFNFVSKVIRPGRSFVSYLINLSTTVKELHYHVHLDRACKQDLRMWELFLSSWNGVSMFHNDVITTSDDLSLYTDASSTVGFSAYYKHSWFCEKRPDEVQSDSSMSFRELWPIVCAAIIWSKQWAQKRLAFFFDNIGTVYILNSVRSKCSKIMSIMRTLTWLAASNKFTFNGVFIRSRDNSKTDSLSRFQFARFRELAPEADLYPVKCPSASEVIWN